LPLYVFCGRHLLVATLRRADRDAADGAVEEVARLVARIRARWPHTRIMLRADSGFARDDLMAWCEANDVDFVFGLARNERLVEAIASELDRAVAKSRRLARRGSRRPTAPFTTKARPRQSRSN
jgi:Transposase DDE domain group 1